MNTVEHIVDCYFRMCRHCFTTNDVKVIGGNNRQLDLLAVNLTDGNQYHVESSVTHSWEWFSGATDLCAELDRKFFGIPLPNAGENSDFSKGKTYQAQIENTYKIFGLNPVDLKRVYCLWFTPVFAGLNGQLEEYSNKRGVRAIEILSFRDTVFPYLESAVGTANYEDEVLRTLSLQLQRRQQLAKLAGPNAHPIK